MDPITPQPQEQPQYQSPISEPKHFLNKKFIITFVVLLLLGGGAYAGIWYWQNQQLAQEVVPTFTPRPSALPGPTANWKTYRNEEYGFEFKYPADWNTVAGPDTSGEDIVVFSPNNNTAIVGHVYFDSDLPVGSSFLDFIHKENSNLKGVTLLSEETKNINGAEVVVNIFTDIAQTKKAKFVDFLNKDNKIFTITTGYRQSVENDNETLSAMKIFDTVVDSFKFTK